MSQWSVGLGYIFPLPQGSWTTHRLLPAFPCPTKIKEIYHCVFSTPTSTKKFLKRDVDSKRFPKEWLDAPPCLHCPGHHSSSIKAFHSRHCTPSTRQMEIQWHWFVYCGPNVLFSGSSVSGSCDLITIGEMKSSPRAQLMGPFFFWMVKKADAHIKSAPHQWGAETNGRTH